MQPLALLPPDGQLATAHVHVDHLYLAGPDQPDPVSEPAHPFAWYGAADLPGLEMFPDARVLARAVLAAVAGEPGAELGPALAGCAGLAGQPR